MTQKVTVYLVWVHGPQESCFGSRDEAEEYLCGFNDLMPEEVTFERRTGTPVALLNADCRFYDGGHVEAENLPLPAAARASAPSAAA